MLANAANKEGDTHPWFIHSLEDFPDAHVHERFLPKSWTYDTL